jgi:hypothetical protein
MSFSAAMHRLCSIAGKKEVFSITVSTFGRPEDVSAENAYECDPWTVYATDTEREVGPDDLKGRCHVTLGDDLKPGAHLPPARLLLEQRRIPLSVEPAWLSQRVLSALYSPTWWCLTDAMCCDVWASERCACRRL